MLLKRIFLSSFLFCVCFCYGQKAKEPAILDTTFYDYDELFSELDALIDSLHTPRSFTLANFSMGNGFFNYVSKTGATAETKRRFTYSPSIGYYDKSGLGLTAGTSLIRDVAGLTPYQYSLTGSYDYLKKRSLITGLSWTHFFTREDLSFYTSPLQNELYGYLTMRKLWFKPSLGVSYGWGSRAAVQQREEQIQNIQLTQRGFTRISTTEKVVDFTIMTSVRHDFYFLNALQKADYIRITPQLTFTSGTQQFGFNMISNTYATMKRTGRNVLYSTQNINFDNQLYFQPLSLTGQLRTEYVWKKIFLQPQFLVDYYLPQSDNRLTTSFLVNVGCMF